MDKAVISDRAAGVFAPIDALQVFSLAVLMSCVGCGPATESGESSLQHAVTCEGISHQLVSRVLSAAEKMGPDEELWLIGRLVDAEPTVRRKAAMALSQARSDGAPVALFLACTQEEDHQVRGALIGALGRLGERGRPLLLALLKREGMSPMLIAALAQSCGVQPAPSRYGAYFVNDVQGRQWWETVGNEQYGGLIETESHY